MVNHLSTKLAGCKGLHTKVCVDYKEIFSPMVKHTSIIFMLSIITNQDLELEQLNVKTAFLHGFLDE